jgi:fumarylacetoacetase
MSTAIDVTHVAGLRSWLESANDPTTDLPIQNLRFVRFRRADDMGWRIGVAIGDQVLDLRRAKLIETHHINGADASAAGGPGVAAPGHQRRPACRQSEGVRASGSPGAAVWCGWACRAGSATTPTSTSLSITR